MVALAGGTHLGHGHDDEDALEEGVPLAVCIPNQVPRLARAPRDQEQCLERELPFCGQVTVRKRQRLERACVRVAWEAKLTLSRVQGGRSEKAKEELPAPSDVLLCAYACHMDATWSR